MTDMQAAGDLLDAVRVVDLSRNLPGPFCTRLLAGLGARVLKVEPPEGDPARALPPLFEALNRGKHSLRLDFRDPGDLARLREHIAQADVLLDSFRPGVAACMGLDYGSLRALNPRLVAVSITGYGAGGPWAGRAGHDLNFMAMSGALDQTRGSSGEPSLPNIQWGDLAGGGDLAAVAILAALVRAGRTGEGCPLSVSMAHGLHAHLVTPKATRAMLTPLIGRAPGAGEDLLNGGLPCYSLYSTRDARYLAVAALEWKFWRTACEAFGKPDWSDKHWQRGLLPGSLESAELREDVSALIGSRDLAEWSERFTSVDACVTPVLTLTEAEAFGPLDYANRSWLDRPSPSTAALQPQPGQIAAAPTLPSGESAVTHPLEEMDITMTANGTWDLVVKSPMGDQASKLILEVEGSSLTGSMSTGAATFVIENGVADPDGPNVSWTANISSPMAMTLEFSGKVDGDMLHGGVKLGAFGMSDFKATRA